MTDEDRLQIMCVEWFDYQYKSLSDFLFHIPNGGKRQSFKNSKGVRFSPEAMKLKRMGVRKGVPDLFLSLPKGKFHGLYIEMKTQIGKVSPEQKNKIVKYKAAGYQVEVCRSFQTFKDTIQDYLMLDDLK